MFWTRTRLLYNKTKNFPPGPNAKALIRVINAVSGAYRFLEDLQALMSCHHKYQHARIQKVFSEVFQLWLRFFIWWGQRGSKYHCKRAIIGPPAKRHLNGVSLAGRWWPKLNAGMVALWFYRGSGPVLQRNPIFLCFFRGYGSPAPYPPPPPPPFGSAQDLILN